MRYLSVCSGIEAATVAWHPLGFEPVAFAEVEPFPSAVLKHHYPAVPNYGDLTKFKEWPDAAIDVLVGGTPCQSFSVAGLRAGLDDPRGNLALTYLAVAERYRPRWVVWENVPGVLSSGDGRDFGSFLGGLAAGPAGDEVANLIAFAELADPVAANQARTYTREGANNFRLSNVAHTTTAVRRLTPRECERLQGFPDDYTLIRYRGKPAADGPRYKALGNSMAVPVMAWIGRRIQTVDALDLIAEQTA